jgi:hypothetical protein
MFGKEIIKYSPQLLKSVLLLTLAVSGNFVGETLGCKTQYHMSNNMKVKHMVLLFIIYFTLNFTSDDKPNPIESIRNALMIWICFLLFTKQNLTFTMLTAALFVGTYVLDNFIDYDKRLMEDADEEEKARLQDQIKRVTTYRNYAFKGGMVSLVVGFLIYLKEKKEEYGADFDYTNFILGKVNCKSLQ